MLHLSFWVCVISCPRFQPHLLLPPLSRPLRAWAVLHGLFSLPGISVPTCLAPRHSSGGTQLLFWDLVPWSCPTELTTGPAVEPTWRSLCGGVLFTHLSLDTQPGACWGQGAKSPASVTLGVGSVWWLKEWTNKCSIQHSIQLNIYLLDARHCCWSLGYVMNKLCPQGVYIRAARKHSKPTIWYQVCWECFYDLRLHKTTSSELKIHNHLPGFSVFPPNPFFLRELIQASNSSIWMTPILSVSLTPSQASL